MRVLLRAVLLGVVLASAFCQGVRAQVQPMPIGVENTTWIGDETLQNYGRLEFRFRDNGGVTMIDTHEQTEGTYSERGMRVTLNFCNGDVIYEGHVRGATLEGFAWNRRSGTRWTFTVRMPEPPNPPPGPRSPFPPPSQLPESRLPFPPPAPPSPPLPPLQLP